MTATTTKPSAAAAAAAAAAEPHQQETEHIRGTKIKAVPYDWPHDASFSRNTTALLVIDMQRDFCEEGGYLTTQGYSIASARSIIPAILALVRACSAASIPVIFTREGHRPDLSTLSSRERTRSRNNPAGVGIGDPSARLGRCLVRGQPGHQVIPELAAFVNESNVVGKPGRSAFAHTELELVLRLRGVRNLVIVGVTTDVCVHSTMREANDRGFDCVLVEDACAAATDELHSFALESVRSEGGIFGSTCMLADVLEAVESLKS